MKARKLAALVLGVGVCLGLSACGGSSGVSVQPMQSMQPPPPMQPQTVTLAVGDVLTKAKMSSETDDPFAVDGSAVAVTPTNDETSDPVTVD